MISEVDYKRLVWHSRRGMLELDVLLGPFTEHHPKSLLRRPGTLCASDRCGRRGYLGGCRALWRRMMPVSRVWWPWSTKRLARNGQIMKLPVRCWRAMDFNDLSFRGLVNAQGVPSAPYWALGSVNVCRCGVLARILFQLSPGKGPRPPPMGVCTQTAEK